MKLAVFAYNFPHKKTQDFLFRLFLERADVAIVLAADPVKLNIPPSILRLKPKYGALNHPGRIAERFGWRYEVVEHNSLTSVELLKSLQIDVGVIAGARILKEPVVSSTRLGIVNFHPGLLPEVRGLDALQWAIYENKPLGVTAHIIDERVDAGRIVLRRHIDILEDDELIDLSMRLQDAQVDMLPEVLKIFSERKTSEFGLVGQAPLHKKMPAGIERQIPQLLAQRVPRGSPKASA